METLFVAVVALVAGFLLAALLLYELVKTRLEAQFEERLRQTREQATEEALKRSRATLKGQSRYPLSGKLSAIGIKVL